MGSKYIRTILLTCISPLPEYAGRKSLSYLDYNGLLSSAELNRGILKKFSFFPGDSPNRPDPFIMQSMKITPELLINAYAQGIFPMAHRGRIYWYDPDPRTILPLDGFHVPRRLQRVIRQNRFEIRLDSDFRGVMQACALPAPGRPTTWINDELIDLYVALHRAGFAHSVETWQNGQMVGGLYGVTLRGLFAGESMFSRVRDASKVALVHLVERLRAGGFVLLDTQFTTPHLLRFGAIEIPRAEYHRRLADALRIQADFLVDF
jgi:leucyl/phenylalanyl-tRNA--protein transferase